MFYIILSYNLNRFHPSSGRTILMTESKITTTCKKKQKGLQGLDLINAFLFRASTEKTKDAEFIAKLIIERAMGHKVEQISVVSEKPLTGIDVGRHGICMDLYVEEYEGERRARVYDSEPNNYGMEELPLRSRYSQALTDVKLLELRRTAKLHIYLDTAI